MLKNSALSEDHRVRVAAERREKTRLKLLGSALKVIYEKGLNDVIADDFITAAGVSRGTFYKYFDTINDLVQALAIAMSDEYIFAINDHILTCKDPLVRLAHGTRLYMTMALRFPIWGSFLSRVGVAIAARGQPIEEYITRDLSEAMDAGLIQINNLLAARDMLVGSIFYGIGSMVTAYLPDHPQDLVAVVLKGLAVPDDLITSLAYGPIPTLGPMNGPLFTMITPKTANDFP